MSARQLMKRGEREVAVYIRNECCRPGGESQLNDLLDYLLDPSKPIDDGDHLKWCRALIAGEMSFDEFSRTVSSYDDAAVCGLVWTADFVAYRCRTCAISPCMSLCSECFHAADHSGHDFNMFRSQAGGACDCGDIEVLKPIGFCNRHGPNRKASRPIPAELTAVPTIVIKRLIFRLLQYYREHFPVDKHLDYTVQMPESLKFIELLQQLSDMGAAMKAVISRVVNDPDIYQQFICRINEPSRAHKHIQDNYELARDCMDSVPVPAEFSDVQELKEPLQHTTLLDELFFWTIGYDFPQSLATFLLSLLPNEQFKEAFTVTFVRHYGLVTAVMMAARNKSEISNRVVHISVQLLSPPQLAYTMVTKYHLLHVVLASLRHLVDSILTIDETPECDSSHHVVDCSKDLLRGHSYWPVVSDLINLLVHRDVALYLLTDKKLLAFWAKIISCFQGMNVNVRELKQHVVYEPESYYAAFGAELEVCSAIMWSLVVHLNDGSTAIHTKNMLEAIVTALKNWFTATRTNRFTVPHRLQMSFHYPLHRYFAVFVCNAVTNQHMDLDDLLPSISFLHMLMIHPLHLIVCYNEIMIGMWVRNGHQIRGQAMTYLQSHFCNSTVDADIYLLQLISSQLDPDYVIHTILDRFGVLNVLTFGHETNRLQRFLPPYREKEHELPMLENAVAFLCLLLNNKANLDMTPTAIARREMVTLLAIADRTHSQLMDAVPEKCGLPSLNKDNESLLLQVADFKIPVFEAGGTMQQGKYVLKGSVWLNEYDPLHCLLRAMHRREIQAAHDRFADFIKQQGICRQPCNLWPPFRVPVQSHETYAGLNKLLHCRSTHAMLFTLLYKALNQSQFPESIAYYTLHLLELALSIPNPDADRRKILIEAKQLDRQFSQWFATDNILTNLLTVIRDVTVEERQPQSNDLSLSSDVTPASSAAAASNLSSILSASSLVTLGNIDDDDMEDDLAMVMTATSEFDLLTLPSLYALDVVPVPVYDSPVLEQDGATSSSQSPAHRSCGVAADSSAAVTTVAVPVNESMLTILLQLYKRFASTSPSTSSSRESHYQFVASKAQSTIESRIGSATFFIGKVLDKICMQNPECCEVVSNLCRDSSAKFADASAADKKPVTKDDAEDRRKKAKQRQERLMKEFANKQKQFMEKIGKMPDFDKADSEKSDGEKMELANETLYDCCICSQSVLSTADRVVGLVAFLQPTSVLGHRRRSKDPTELSVSDAMSADHDIHFMTEFLRRFNSLRKQFDATSCVSSFNVGWEGGVYAQTCGHYLHLDCQKSYVQSLTMNTNQSQPLTADEYWCPLCRQLSNTVIPILPDLSAAASCPPSGCRIDVVQHTAELLATANNSRPSRSVMTAMGQIIQDLSNATAPNHRILVEDNEMTLYAFITSILRTNVELEIDMHAGSPCLPPSSSFVHKKSCIPILFNVLNTNSKNLLHESNVQLWSALTGCTLDSYSNSLSVYHKQLPLLLRDTTCLFLRLVLGMPLPIEPDVYRCIARAVFNLQRLQFLVSVTCQMTRAERQLVKVKGQQSVATDIEMLLCGLVHLFERSPLAFLDASINPALRAICCRAWFEPTTSETGTSRTSADFDLAHAQHVLPLLRVIALLQYHIFGLAELPTISDLGDDITELTLLSDYIGITTTGTAANMTGGDTTTHSERWHQFAVVNSAPIDTWCQQLFASCTENVTEVAQMLTTIPMWYPAQLVALPLHYEHIFNYYRRKICCSTCSKTIGNPAICLVCGNLVSYKESGCRGNRLRCTQHSVLCGSGTAVYLLVNSSMILIIRGARAAAWGSVYLDAYGEEDLELKRGKPLHLSVERYRLLQNLWTSHSFDHSCKNWVVHQNKI